MAFHEEIYPEILQWIRERVREEDYSISEHVVRFIVFGKISVSDIERAVEAGLIVEVRRNLRKQEAWLVRGRVDGAAVSVLCTKGEDGQLVVLLTLRETPPQWEELGWIREQQGEFMTDSERRCYFCGGKIESVVVGNFDYRLEGNLYVVKNVPAGLCLDCGEKYVSAETAKKINARVAAEDFSDTEAVRVMAYRE